VLGVVVLEVDTGYYRGNVMWVQIKIKPDFDYENCLVGKNLLQAIYCFVAVYNLHLFKQLKA
jgi:hypothetical protein